MAARRTLPSSRPQQERLHSLIKSNPGIHIRSLAQLMGLSWNTCLHHLRSMEHHGTVVARKVQGRVCYFDRSAGAVKDKLAVCLMRDPENKRLARAVVASPGRKQVELARSLDMATSTVHRRVARLEQAGLLRRLDEERARHVFPAEALTPFLDHGGPLGPGRTPMALASRMPLEEDQESTAGPLA